MSHLYIYNNKISLFLIKFFFVLDARLLTVASHVGRAAKVLLTEAALLKVAAVVLLWLVLLVLTAAAAAVVVVVSEGLVDVQLVLLEDELFVLEGQDFGGVVLVVVGDKAESARISYLIGDDAGILDHAEVGEVVSQLILRSSLWDTTNVDSVRNAVATLVAATLLEVVLSGLVIVIVVHP